MLLLLLLSLWSTSPAFAMRLRVQGAVLDLDDGRPLGGVEVKVYRDGVRQPSVRTGANGRYSVVLDRGGEYALRFSLPGHVSKCFAVDTRGAAWEGDRRVKLLEVDMILFEPLDGLDLGFFDMPMGIARFDPMTGNVIWNADHERRIRPVAERLTAELVRRRQMALAQRREEPAVTVVRQ